MAGTTKYVDFPVTPGAYDSSFNGGSGPGGSDAFVAKINAAGTDFDYVTYLGGSGNDEASAQLLVHRPAHHDGPRTNGIVGPQPE